MVHKQKQAFFSVPKPSAYKRLHSVNAYACQKAPATTRFSVTLSPVYFSVVFYTVWQSMRLLTAGSLVRVQLEEPSKKPEKSGFLAYIGYF